VITTKLKIDHNTKDMPTAFGITDEKHDKEIRDQMQSALTRGLFDPTMKKISAEVEIAVSACKTVEEVAYAAFTFGRLREEAKAKMHKLVDMMKEKQAKEEVSG